MRVEQERVRRNAEFQSRKRTIIYMYTNGSILKVTMEELNKYERELLEGWETAYKKGQLTLLILLALKEGPKHMAEIKGFIQQASDGHMLADDKSMYRALRRHDEVEMVTYKQMPGEGGPERKVYELTETGSTVLDAFIARNITGLYGKPNVKKLLERIKG